MRLNVLIAVIAICMVQQSNSWPRIRLSRIVTVVKDKVLDKVLDPIGDAIEDVIDKVGDEILDPIGDVIEDVIDKVGDEVLDPIGDAIEDVIDKVGDEILDPIGDAIEDVIDKVGDEVLDPIGDAIKDVIVKVGDEVLGPIGDAIEDVIDDTTDYCSNIIRRSVWGAQEISPNPIVNPPLDKVTIYVGKVICATETCTDEIKGVILIITNDSSKETVALNQFFSCGKQAGYLTQSFNYTVKQDPATIIPAECRKIIRAADWGAPVISPNAAVSLPLGTVAVYAGEEICRTETCTAEAKALHTDDESYNFLIYRDRILEGVGWNFQSNHHSRGSRRLSEFGVVIIETENYDEKQTEKVIAILIICGMKMKTIKPDFAWREDVQWRN